MVDWLHEIRPNKKAVIPSKKITFRDLNCDYLLNHSQNKLMLDNNLAVRNQIKNLLSTTVGTEDFEPNYGSNIPYRIMEPISKFTAHLLKMDTIIAIQDWMSDRVRVHMSGAAVVPLASEDGYNINLPYNLILDDSFSIFNFDILR